MHLRVNEELVAGIKVKMKDEILDQNVKSFRNIVFFVSFFNFSIDFLVVSMVKFSGAIRPQL